MNFIGIGGFEFAVILVVAFFIVGPKRMVQGMREARKVYTELRRQRTELTSMLKEAIELDDLKKELAVDGLSEEIKGIQSELTLDQPDDGATSNRPLSSTPRPQSSPASSASGAREATPGLDLDSSGDDGDSTERQS